MLVKNIMLHAREDQQKTVTFSEEVENSSSSQLSKGLLNCENQCTECKKCSIPYDCLVPCGNCRNLFHITCISVPIDYDNARVVRENPGIWWICFNCINANSSTIEHENHDNLDKLIDDKIQSLLGNFKDELLSGITAKLNSLPIQAPSTSLPAAVGSVTVGMKRKADGDNNHNGTSKIRKKSVADTPIVVIPQSPEISVNNSVDAVIDLVREGSPRSNDIGTPRLNSSRSAQKYILHFRPVSHGLILKDDEWDDLRKSMSDKLAHIKVLFSHFNRKTGKIVVGFPNKQSQDTAVGLLKDVVNVCCYELYIPEKMLPKLTLHNVPLDFDLADTISSGLEQRDLVKGKIWQTIVDKNEGVRTLIENGSILEIVYFRKHKYSSTVAIKVSPDIRLYILEKLHVKLFLFSSCCRASDRCHYQQCYHCLKFGHISKNCPKINEPPICMYCAESHDSRSCNIKQCAPNYKCYNCLSSNQPQGSLNHCACSPSCPSALTIANRIQLNTQLEVQSSKLPKNM